LGGEHGVSEGKGVRVLKGQETTPAFGLAKNLGFPFIFSLIERINSDKMIGNVFPLKRGKLWQIKIN